MSKNFYKMYPEEHFAIVKFKPGILTINEGEIINQEYKNDPNYSSIHYLLIILNDCTPNFNHKDLNKISEFYNKDLQTNNHVSTAWVVDAPLLTALAHIFVDTTQEQSHYCSTIEKAYSLLEIPIPFYKFKALIDISIEENK